MPAAPPLVTLEGLVAHLPWRRADELLREANRLADADPNPSSALVARHVRALLEKETPCPTAMKTAS